MAKENTVWLYGYLSDGLKLAKSKEDPRKYGYMEFTIRVVRRGKLKNKKLDGKQREDDILVISRDQDLIQRILDQYKAYKLKNGVNLNFKKQMAMVKGNLCTKYVNRKITCSHCGKQFVKESSSLHYVDPVDIKLCESMQSPTNIELLLNEHEEISNQCYVFGTVCQEPNYNTLVSADGRTQKLLECNLAINRKRTILQDDPEDKTDYPWMRAFGSLAEEASKALQLRSQIYIHGALQSRISHSQIICPYCGEATSEEKPILEIVPYSIEYGGGCNKPASSYLSEADLDEYFGDLEDYYMGKEDFEYQETEETSEESLEENTEENTEES